MTEINFVEGGYWAAQWTYNIPPVGNPPAEFSYQYDSLASDLRQMSLGYICFPIILTVPPTPMVLIF